MEKRTFLAILISIIFLFAYNSLVIAPQRKANPQVILQVDDNKLLTTATTTTSINLVPQNLDETFETLENKHFRVKFSSKSGRISEIYSISDNYSAALSNFLNLSNTSKLESYNSDESGFTFIYRDKELVISRKLYTLDSNRIRCEINFINNSNLSILNNVQFNLFDVDIHKIKEDKDKLRDNILFEYSIYLNKKVIRKGNAFKFSSKENKTSHESIEWAGWRDRYHFTIVKPEFKSKMYSISSVDDHRLSISISPDEVNLLPGAAQKFEFSIYMGPQDLALLKDLGGNLKDIMAFSGYKFLDFIEKIIYKALIFIHKFIPNWGLCIIFISVFIYGITYPLTLKSMLSMRKMQELQPKMTELKEKYKNNPQKLNTEVVQLYKIHNVNPLSGCLPMLLQMPVFISLYQVLWRTHDFQGANFLWIKDLSIPDKLFLFPMDLPFVGNEFNLLPILMTIIMFFQQKLSAKNMIITDPAQEMQQKMMIFIMPIFIGAMFYKFASGLTLYFTVFYLLSTLSQYKMSKLNKVK